MPKAVLREGYRFNGQVYGPSFGQEIEVPEEVARAAGYQAALPPSDEALKGTPADQGETSNALAGNTEPQAGPNDPPVEPVDGTESHRAMPPQTGDANTEPQTPANPQPQTDPRGGKGKK